jgi:CRP/FNR family transcriptional regulator, cyclic AMP receptor protein
MVLKQRDLHSDPRTHAFTRAPISQEERVELLAHVSLFSGLSRRELRQLADAAIQRDFPAGTMIIEQGQMGIGFYVVVSGCALIQQRRADGSEREMATLGPGAIFGEIALLDLFPRSASVVALQATSALVIPIWEFRTLLAGEPAIAMKLLDVLAQRLRTTESTATS